MQARPAKWLRRMFGLKVISRREMREFARALEEAPEGQWSPIPEHLHQAAERISLFEEPSPSQMVH